MARWYRSASLFGYDTIGGNNKSLNFFNKTKAFINKTKNKMKNNKTNLKNVKHNHSSYSTISVILYYYGNNTITLYLLVLSDL